jgi:hypothetical protein
VTGKRALYTSAYTREDFLKHFPDFENNDTLVREVLRMAEYAVEYGYFRKDLDWLWSRQMDACTPNWKQFLRTTGWQGQKISYL